MPSILPGHVHRENSRKQTDGIEQRWRHLVVVVVVVSCLKNDEEELTELQVGVRLEKV